MFAVESIKLETDEKKNKIRRDVRKTTGGRKFFPTATLLFWEMQDPYMPTPSFRQPSIASGGYRGGHTPAKRLTVPGPGKAAGNKVWARLTRDKFQDVCN